MNLKFLLFLIFFCCVFQFSGAQKWCQPGATWYFQERGIVSITLQVFQAGYDKAQYVKDTVINGQSCKVITDTSYYEGNNGIQPGGTIYTYELNGTVYFLYGNTFVASFYFGCHTGDILLVPWQGRRIATHVDSTGIVVINGDSLRFYDYTAVDSVYACELGNAGATSSNGRVIERIGNLAVDPGNNCFSFDFGCFEWNGQYNFHCYQDDSFPLYSTDSTTSCTYILSSINETKNDIGISLFPNPANTYCNLQLSNTGKTFNAGVYDITGQLVMLLFNKASISNFGFSTLQLTSGLYFIKIVDEDGRIAVTRFVKN